jgi:hypothetical protein
MLALAWVALISVESGASYWHVAGSRHYEAALGEGRLAAGVEHGRWSLFGTFRFELGRRFEGDSADSAYTVGTLQVGAGARLRLGSRVRVGIDTGIGIFVDEHYDEGPVQDYFGSVSFEGVIEVDLVHGAWGALFAGGRVGGLFSVGESTVGGLDLGKRELATCQLGIGYRW